MNNKNTIPKLRFSEFNDEWQIKSFYNVFDRVKRKNKENNQNILTISAQDGLISQREFFSKLVAAKNVTSYYLLHKNDYAYNKSYSKGYPMGAIKRLIHNNKGVVSTLYICFACKDGMELFYDQYFEAGKLNTEIEKIAQEGARNHGLLNMNIDYFFDISLIVPSKPEQEKIAEFLTVVDKKIARIDIKVDLLKKYKKGIMQKIFTQHTRFKDENNNTCPDWEIVKAGSIFRNISNKKHNGYLPVLSVTQDEGIVLRDSLDRKIDSSDAGMKNYKIIEPDDFVISLRSFQGGIEMSNVTGISSPAYTVIRGNNNVIPAMYKHYFKRDQFISKLNATIYGIRDGKQISYSNFSKIKIPIPPVEEQLWIANYLNLLDEKIKLEETKLNQAKKYKKALLQRMFV